MSSFLIFNHHALPFESKGRASSAIPEFLKICLRSQSLGLSTILIDESVDTGWFRLKLANGFFWQDWYNQNNDNEHKDLIRAFRLILTRQPFFSSEDNGDELEFFEVQLNGRDSYPALRAAVWHEAPIASFPTRSPWDNSPVEVQVNKLEPDGQLTSSVCSITNFYSISVLEEMENEILGTRDALIRSGKEILKRQKDLYPHVEFCGKAEQQLSQWSFSNTILEQAKESFKILSYFGLKWKQGEIAAYSDQGLVYLGLNHKVSGESATVLLNRNLRKEREFWLPNGRKEVFEKHIKISNGFRIHFFPDNQSRLIYVGYIGPHLRLR